MTTGQIPITDSASLIVGSNAKRDVLIIHAAADIFIGGSDEVTAETGFLIKAGIPHYLIDKGIIYGIASEDTTVYFIDQNKQV